MALEDVRTAIESLLRTEGYLDENIRFEGLESDPRNASIKLVYTGFSDSEVTVDCLPKLHTILPMVCPIPAAHPPPHEDPVNMDLTPSVPGSPPLNCSKLLSALVLWAAVLSAHRISLQHASTHGRTFHQHLYMQLPKDILTRIGWFKCEPACGHLPGINIGLELTYGHFRNSLILQLAEKDYKKHKLDF